MPVYIYNKGKADPTETQYVEEQDTLLPTEGNNPSFSLSYDGDGNLTQVDKIIGGITYRKTLTWAAGNLTDVSVWSAI